MSIGPGYVGWKGLQRRASLHAGPRPYIPLEKRGHVKNGGSDGRQPGKITLALEKNGVHYAVAKKGRSMFCSSAIAFDSETIDPWTVRAIIRCTPRNFRESKRVNRRRWRLKRLEQLFRANTTLGTGISHRPHGP